MWSNRVRVSAGGRRMGVIGCIISSVLSLVILVCMLGVFFFVFGALRSSEVVTQAVSRLEENRTAVAVLGSPVEVGWLISGSLETNADGTGYASLSVPVSGPYDKGRLRIEANKSGGAWEYAVLELTPKSSGDAIDLLSSR